MFILFHFLPPLLGRPEISGMIYSLLVLWVRGEKFFSFINHRRGCKGEKKGEKATERRKLKPITYGGGGKLDK